MAVCLPVTIILPIPPRNFAGQEFFFFKAPFGKREEWQFSHFYATFASNEIFQN